MFDFPVIDALVTKAELVLHLHEPVAPYFEHGYVSQDDYETLSVYDVSTDIDTLRAGSDNTSGVAKIWEDLGSGVQYGHRTFTIADEGKFVHIPLNATARIQARAGGKLALGAAITTLTNKANYAEQLFQFSSTESVSLELTIAGSQPDGWILNGGAWKGYGVTNTTAADQTITRSAAPGKTLTYRVGITHGSGVDEQYVVKAGGSTSAYKVRYLVDGSDVTTKVKAGTYLAPSVTDGTRTSEMIVKITVTSSATAGSKLARPITITSIGDPTRVDVVKVVAKRR